MLFWTSSIDKIARPLPFLRYDVDICIQLILKFKKSFEKYHSVSPKIPFLGHPVYLLVLKDWYHFGLQILLLLKGGNNHYCSMHRSWVICIWKMFNFFVCPISGSNLPDYSYRVFNPWAKLHWSEVSLCLSLNYHNTLNKHRILVS